MSASPAPANEQTPGADAEASETPVETAQPSQEEDAMQVDQDDQAQREASTGSVSSHTQKRKRSSEHTNVAEPPAKLRRTKRATVPVAPPPSTRDRTRSSGTSKKPTVVRGRMSRRQRGAAAEDEESALVDDGGETRCVCGLNDEDNWDGIMLQCETCNCWQHGSCVGIMDERDAPKHYFCEQCRPDLHPEPKPEPEIDEESGQVEDEEAAEEGDEDEDEKPEVNGKSGRRSSDDDKSDVPVYPPTSHFAEPKNPGRRRSTMNSRDAAYEESLAQALALSQQDSGVALSRSGSKSRAGTQDLDERPPPKRRQAARGGSKRGKAAVPSPVEDNAEELAVEEPSEPVEPTETNDLPVDGRDESPPRSTSPADSDMPLARPARNQKRARTTLARQQSPDDSSDGGSGSVPPTSKARKGKANGDKAARAPSSKSRKAVLAKDTDGDDSSVPLASIAAARKRKKGGAAVNLADAAAKAAAVVAVANAVAADEAEEVGTRHTNNPWHLPAHLEHLAPSLGAVPVAPLQPKPKYPTKRATIVDMRKRTTGLLKYLERSNDLLDKMSAAPSSQGSARDLIAELQGEVKIWQQKFADVPSVPARSQLAQSATVEA